jgi:hypothetical protein
MTLYAGLQSTYPLAGLMLLSGFVPLATTLPLVRPRFKTARRLCAVLRFLPLEQRRRL